VTGFPPAVRPSSCEVMLKKPLSIQELRKVLEELPS
jgi:hypothetical protein